MDLTLSDGVTFAAFLAAVIGISLYASRKEDTLRRLLPGGQKPDLVAHRLFTHRVQHLDRTLCRHGGLRPSDVVGLAIASYEWIVGDRAGLRRLVAAAPVLEGSASTPCRSTWSTATGQRRLAPPWPIYMMAAYVIVFLATVLFSGAVALNAIFDMHRYVRGPFRHATGLQAEFWASVAGIWLIGIVAGCVHDLRRLEGSGVVRSSYREAALLHRRRHRRLVTWG